MACVSVSFHLISSFRFRISERLQSDPSSAPYLVPHHVALGALLAALVVEEEDDDGDVVMVLPPLTRGHAQEVLVANLTAVRRALQGLSDELAGNVLRVGRERACEQGMDGDQWGIGRK